MSNYFNSMSERTFRVVVLILFVVIFTLTLFMLAAGGASASTVAPSVQPGPTPAWAWAKNWDACPNDDQSPLRCVWQARVMGNGTGTSYIQTKRGHVIYISHRDATALLRPTYAL